MTAILYGVASVGLGLTTLCLAYLYLLALASVRTPRLTIPAQPQHRLAIAIPAHNEEATIGRTVQNLLAQNYPRAQFEVFVIADNCADATLQAAALAGANSLERQDPNQRGKGYALSALFAHILPQHPSFDGIVVFDADTVVDPDFLKVMDAMLLAGHQVIQGNHIILNPDQGWLPAVMYIAFAMDNRLRNLGRSNLGLSSKLMGDGMCFARQILEAHPWQAVSQTEDVEYRAQLSLAGVRVAFAPQAKAFGEMVTTLKSAGGQRARWMRGRTDITRQLFPRLFDQWLRGANWLALDAALDLVLPSFSTLVVLTGLFTLLGTVLSSISISLWVLLLWLGLLAYPVLALVLVQAPPKLYFYLAFAPFYAIWRTWLRVVIRFQHPPAGWVRTARSTEVQSHTPK